MSLKTQFMGLDLDNPLIVAAGPWCSHPDQILNLFEKGAGAVITETIATEVRPNVRPWLLSQGKGYGNVRLYSDHGLEKWMDFLKKIKMSSKQEKPLIASILAHSPSEMAYIASCVEKSGASGVELGISSPHGEGVAVLAANPEALYKTVKAVCNQVDIPVMVKLSAHVRNISQLARAAEQAGACGVSAIDSVRCIPGVDLEKKSPLLGTYGGYSGPPIKPIGLATVAVLAQSVSIDVCGVGGIQNGKDALEYMMLGAKTFQVGTGILTYGTDVICQILDDVNQWLKDHKESFSSTVGAALKGIKAFDEMDGLPYRVRLKRKCAQERCNLCIHSCSVQAIKRKSNRIEIDNQRCNGCGLCVNLCPENYLELTW